MSKKPAVLSKSKSVMVRFDTSYANSVKLAENADIFGIDLKMKSGDDQRRRHSAIIQPSFDRTKSIRQFTGSTIAKSKRLDKAAQQPLRSKSLRVLCIVTRAICLFKRNLNKYSMVSCTSLSIDPELLVKIPGYLVYEQRSMYELLNLRKSRVRLAYCTSVPISPAIVNYYLDLAARGDAAVLADMRARLLLLDCEDATALPLSSKILERPMVLNELREWCSNGPSQRCFLKVFLSTSLELELAVNLGLPLRANDPELAYLGSKSGSRTLFAAASVPHPDGWLELDRDEDAVLRHLDELWTRNPKLRKVVVKLDEGVSGEGNTLVRLPAERSPDAAARLAALRRAFRAMEPSAAGETYQGFSRQMRRMGVVGEAWLEVAPELSNRVRSPSVQGLISPGGAVTILSTHEQILNGQIYLGCEFPAHLDYRAQLVSHGRAIGEQLAERGAQGRYAVDFMAMPDADGGPGCSLYAIEINLREGGTTHPWATAALLSDGVPDRQDAQLMSARGRGPPIFYKATDNLIEPEFKGLRPKDFLNLVEQTGLGYDGQRGAVFHLLGCLSELGKVGMVCIASSADQAREMYDEIRGKLKQLAASVQSALAQDSKALAKNADTEIGHEKAPKKKGKKKRKSNKKK